MKILEFTAAKKTAVITHREKLAAARADVLKKSTGGRAALEKQEETLIAEIASLEKTALGDRDALRTLGEKRTAIGIVQSQLKNLPPVVDIPDSELRSVLRETRQVIITALLPTEEAYIGEIIEKLLPYCLDRVHANWMARQTSAAASLAGRVHPRFTESAPIPESKRALQCLDEILTGELNWSYTPQS